MQVPRFHPDQRNQNSAGGSCMVKCSHGASHGELGLSPAALSQASVHCRPSLSPGPCSGLLSPVIPLPLPSPLCHQTEFPNTHLIPPLPPSGYSLELWGSYRVVCLDPTLTSTRLLQSSSGKCFLISPQACSRCCVSSISTALRDYRHI